MSPRSRSIPDPLSPALLEALRAQIGPGERLAWAARPEPAAFERNEKRGIGKWETGAILGGGYALLGSGAVALRTGQWLWLSIPIALVALGGLGYFVASRIKARAQRSLAGTVYGFTTRRALLVRTYPALAVRAVPIEAITDITLTDERGDFADLCFRTTDTQEDLVFRGLPEAERSRTQLLRVVRDPQATDQEIAASEAYAAAMHQMRRMSRPASS
jgi:hypothetical protein